jgi:HSP20 family molecular chaperone IbpA
MNGAEAKNGATAKDFEQMITLPEPVRADQMQIQRKQNLVVITVPKTNPTAVANASPSASQSSGAPNFPSTASAAQNWDQRMIESMQGMEARMDKLFQTAFPSAMTNNPNTLELGSAVNVEDQKNKYVVHFALPGQDVSNVNVNFENGELRLTAQEKKETNSKNFVERGHYEELVTLPGPVKESEMQVNRQANAVVVILPKA